VGASEDEIYAAFQRWQGEDAAWLISHPEAMALEKVEAEKWVKETGWWLRRPWLLYPLIWLRNGFFWALTIILFYGAFQWRGIWQWLSWLGVGMFVFGCWCQWRRR
jgi:hypothetical protein